MRYHINLPGTNFPFYQVIDTQSQIHPNYAVVNVSVSVPNAQEFVNDLVEKLNGESNKSRDGVGEQSV